MSTDRAQLVRTALAISEQLERRRIAFTLSDLPTETWERCQRHRSQLALAEARSWPAAAAACRDRLRWSLIYLRHQVDASLEQLNPPPTGENASARDVYEDLLALDAEFETTAIDLKERLLTVTIESVELEGVYLGRFSIALEWERLHERSACYAIIALDPQPDAIDSSVVHPHVRDGNLCEGEGWGAIRAALSSGRLLDFFTIVARTLASYNPDSAYVSLDQWEGVACADCGSTTDDDDRTSCEACDCDICCDCSARCNECTRSLCSECSCSCCQCRDTYCAGCLVECTACHEDYCGGCLNDGICKHCGEAADEKDALGEAQADSPAAAAPEAAVLAVCLGQTAVPA